MLLLIDNYDSFTYNLVHYLGELGADMTIDRNADFLTMIGESSIDVVLDLVGGERWPSLLEILRSGGRYATSGAIGGPIVELDLRTLYLKDQTLFGCTVLEPDVFGNLVRRIERGDIKPLVAATYPLQELNAAQQAFQAKGHIGKIVLTVSDDV